MILEEYLNKPFKTNGDGSQVIIKDEWDNLSRNKKRYIQTQLKKGKVPDFYNILFSYDLEMKQCKSYKEFIKIVRKYGLKTWRKTGKTWWYIWLEYNIYTEEQVKECLRHTKWCINNLPLILQDFLKDKDKEVYFTPKVSGKLIGIQITNEDYYWICQSKDGRKHLASCVGKYYILNEYASVINRADEAS